MISNMSIQFCEYNRSNPDADRIYRPQGSGDYLFLLLKTPMKVYQENGILLTGENACILYTPGQMQHYQAIQKFRNSYLHFVAQENLAEYFQLPQNQVFYPRNPEEIEETGERRQPAAGGPAPSGRFRAGADMETGRRWPERDGRADR